MSNPGKLIKATLFFEGGQLIGQGEVTLPNIQPDMNEFKSFGTSGSVELPMNTFQAMESQIKVTAPNARFFIAALKPGVPFQISFRGDFQVFDPVSGVSKIGERCQMKLVQKGFNLGSRNQSEGGEFDATFSVLTVAYFVGGAEILFFDPINNVYRVDGVDYLAEDRAILGL